MPDQTASEHRAQERRVPVVVLTGHLGAGKTTVLNHLLQRPGGRIGVVVNDFGDINVDAGLVVGQVDEPASISGGCLCCLPDTGGLDDALERLTHPRLRLDAVVVEASGIADPLTLSRLVRFSGVERVRPGGVVEVVDAVEHFRTVDTRERPPARLAAASLVVVNKTDRLPRARREAALARIERRVREVNPVAHVVGSAHGRIDPELLFDVACGEDPGDELPLAALRRDAHADDHVHVGAATARSPGTVDPARVIDLLEQPPPGCYRIKGRVTVQSAGRLRGYVVHLVGRSIHISSSQAGRAGSELVAVGMHLDVDRTRARLEDAVAAPARDLPIRADGFRRLQRYRRLST